MAASSAPNHPPELLVLSHPSEEFCSPDDIDDETADADDLADATGRDAAAAVAARRAPRREEFSPPSPGRGASPTRPTARSRPLVSTPMPEMGQVLLHNRRPRRDVARPVSYEEPSLGVKMRK